MKKWYLLFLIICSCGAHADPAYYFNPARYDYPNSIKEQILNADCIELIDIMTELKMSLKMISKPKLFSSSALKNRKSYSRAIDSLRILMAATFDGRYKSGCLKWQRNAKKRIN
jgi:hypothetical protein